MPCPLVAKRNDMIRFGSRHLAIARTVGWFLHHLSNCIRLNDISAGKQLHSLLIKSGVFMNSSVGTTLTDLYSKTGFVKDARLLFDDISKRDLVLWNVLVSCYALNGLGQQAFKVFNLMRLEGFVGDGFTFSSLLSSCSSLGCSNAGKQTHGLAIRLSLDLDVVVGTALVDMYAKCGDIEYARRAFDAMEVRNIVSWNAIIVCYGRNREGKEPMKLLMLMIQGGWKPDGLTLASVLSSCADSAAGNEATQVHNYAVKIGLEVFPSVGNSLISAYSKSGDIYSALKSFRSISEPDLVTWSSMISCYAFYGHAKEALTMFERMVQEGVRPDGVAFVGVLSACSHAGLVEPGLRYFNSMRKDYWIEPSPEHYACLVDLLARSGRLLDAYDAMTDMPFEPGGDVLGAFIGACRVHGNIGLARRAADWLFRLEPAESVGYSMMSNVYAALGFWDDVAKVRRMLRNRCGNKVPGCSWTEIGGEVHTFVSNDRSHREARHMYCTLGLLNRLMKDEGYISTCNELGG